MNDHLVTADVLKLMDLGEKVIIASDLDSLADEMLPEISRFVGSKGAFLYIAAPQIFTHRFYCRGIEDTSETHLKQLCTEQFDYLMGVPISATNTRSWKIDARFTIFPLRSKQKYVGLLGMALGEDGIPVSSKLWDRYLTALATSVSHLAEQRKSQRQLIHLNNYLTVSSMLAQPLGLHDMLEAALYCCMEMISAEAATVLMLDDDKENFLFYQVEGPAKPVLMASTFSIEHGIAGSVLKTGQAEIINDAHTDPRFYGEIDNVSGFQTRNMIAVPLIAGEEPVGVLEVLNKSDGLPFTEEEQLSLMMIAEEIAFAIRNARIFEYVVDSYCIQRQGLNTCKGCKRPLGSWTPCVKYRESII